MDRRHFLGATAASAVSVLSAGGCTAFNAAPVARPRGARILADFEPAKAIWLGGSDDQEKLEVTARMASALLPHVEVKLVAESTDAVAKTRAALQKLGVEVERIQFFAHPKSAYFIRDYNLFSFDEEGGLGVIDFKWNTYGLPGWCRDHLYPDKPEPAAKCAGYNDAEYDVLDRWMAQVTGASVISSSLYLEGSGAIEVNGQRVLLVSEKLALQRNKPRSRNEIETELLKLPGIRKVIWMAAGAAEDPHMQSTIVGDYVGWGTGGHTDEFVRFADPRTILLAWVDEEDVAAHPINRINHDRMRQNFDILSNATDDQNRPFRILKVPMPHPVEKEVVLAKSWVDDSTWLASVFPSTEGRKTGDRVKHVAAASYLNVVLLPGYTKDGTPPAVEERVAGVFRQAFAGREIKLIRATRLNWSGAGPHSATCNEPAIV